MLFQKRAKYIALWGFGMIMLIKFWKKKGREKCKKKLN